MLAYLLDLVSRLGNWSYLLIFVIAMLECAAFLGLVVPGESLMLACGFLSHQRVLMLDAVIVAGTLGAIIGDNIGYELGRRMGRGWLLAGGARVGLTEARVEAAEVFFERHGSKAVFLGRFVGYARALVPFVAGTSEMDHRVFMLYNALGAVIWAAGVTVLGYFVGASWRLAEAWIGGIGTAVLVVAVLVAGVAWFRHRRTA